MPKNASFGLFFENFACGAENLTKKRTKQCLWEFENQFGRTKKKVDKNFNFFFWKSAPPPLPRKNPRSATACMYQSAIFTAEVLKYYCRFFLLSFSVFEWLDHWVLCRMLVAMAASEETEQEERALLRNETQSQIETPSLPTTTPPRSVGGDVGRHARFSATFLWLSFL